MWHTAFQNGYKGGSSSLYAAMTRVLSGSVPLDLNPAFKHLLDSSVTDPLCGGLDLGQSLALFESSLLLESHNLEAVEVGKTLPPLNLIALLGPVGLLPLGVDLGLLPQLSDDASSRAAVQILDDQS